jgi:hypothetical protein
VQATIAVFWRLPAAFAATLTLSAMTEGPWAGIGVFGLVQVTTWRAARQDHPVPAPLTKVKPAGNVSLTVDTSTLRRTSKLQK